MGHGINVRETVEDRDTWFNVKHFAIGDVSFTRPEKSLDIKPIDKQVYSMVSKTSPFKFTESSKRIPKFEHLVELYQESDENKINEMFSKRAWLNGAPCVLNFTLGFNPMMYVDQKKVFESFLDYYYSYSNFFLTVPSIRTKKWVMKTESSPSHVVEVANQDDYIKSVDLFYDILSTKNKKPIFVPISVRMSAHDLDELLTHYIKRERFAYWVDFDGMAVNPTTLSRLRYLFRRIKDKGRFKDTVTYFTNVKREIISNIKKEKSEASDVLCSAAGANLIGCNREPTRMFQTKPPPIPPEHKARVFDNESYYYVKTKNQRLLQPKMYVTENAVRLSTEIGNQTEFFMLKGGLEPLLSSKEMLATYRDKEVLRNLVSKRDDEGPPRFEDFIE